MSEEKLKIWHQVSTVPANAQKKIKGGRLSGMTDIKPQWRYLRMTEIFGPIGFGWKFVIDRTWTEKGAGELVGAFVNITMFVNDGETWSDGIPGTGGSMFVAKEKDGPYTSDEAFKMATTDALSVAMKMLGVGADIYFGGQCSKYFTTADNTPPASDQPPLITTERFKEIEQLLKDCRKPDDLTPLWKTMTEQEHGSFLDKFSIRKGELS